MGPDVIMDAADVLVCTYQGEVVMSIIFVGEGATLTPMEKAKIIKGALGVYAKVKHPGEKGKYKFLFSEVEEELSAVPAYVQGILPLQWDDYLIN